MSNISGLDAVAYELADRYRDGRWPELKGREWKAVWKFQLGALKELCPGFSEADYAGALEKDFADSRQVGKHPPGTAGDDGPPSIGRGLSNPFPKGAGVGSKVIECRKTEKEIRTNEKITDTGNSSRSVLFDRTIHPGRRDQYKHPDPGEDIHHHP